MKILSLTTLILLSSLLQVEFVKAQSNDIEAIKAVIYSETEAFFNRDLEKWKSGWLKNEDISRTVINSNYHNHVRGWEAMEKMVDEYIKMNPEPVSVKIDQSDFIIHANDKIAWVEFTERLDFENTEDDNEATQQQRTLFKEDGNWKFAGQVTVISPSFSDQPAAIESALNTTGYKLLNTNKIEEAIDVFKTNLKLFPDSWNAYDSMGEAYAAAGDTEKAIANYRKSIELNPDNKHGVEVLQSLRE